MARSKAVSLVGDFKTEITTLAREVAKKKKELDKATELYKRTWKQLSKAYHDLMGLVEQLTEIKVHNTKKENALKKKIKDGRAENVRLTDVRNAYLGQMDTIKETLNVLGSKLMMLKEKELNETRSIDDIVIQVFSLNDAAVQASAAREDCLNRHVFPRLIDARGNLCSQITFASSNGLRKIVAMVNTMTIIRGDLAAEAQREIQHFIERVQKPAKVDPHIEVLFDITRQLLVEKISSKPGPSLYIFLNMEVDAEIFPELARAQVLLRQSIRSEKTNSYIRIYERASRTDTWEVVPQS